MIGWEHFILTAAISFTVCFVSIPLFKWMAGGLKLVDVAGADPLKIHSSPIPFVGGLGMVSGCLLALALIFRSQPQHSTAWIAALGLCAAVLGLCDDRLTVRPAIRLMAEMAIGGAFAATGLATGLFSQLWVWVAERGTIGYGLIIVMVIFFVAGAINAVNMQDGMDGLAGGVALISCLGFATVGFLLGHALAAALAVALAGALAAFLIYNFHPATVFMGDNGSYFLGFMLSAIALMLIFAAGNAMSFLGGALIIGAPVFDAAFAVVRRLSRGVSPFAGDRSHFYDYLAKRGLSTRKVAMVSYAMQICFVLIGACLFISGI
jgi:UDP-GlcNAc:undecaprenyl-phosphate GlcNAc-1-phosphate transferase